jgi:hypothetical protein
MAAFERQGPLPVELVTGWPVRPPDSALRATEAGIILGAFRLPGLIEALRQSSPARSLRIDNDVESESWTDRQGHSIRVVHPPSVPVSVPEEALGDLDSLERWVQETHGSTGRIILISPTGAWWILNDSGLELSLTSGPPAWTVSVAGEADYEPFSWLPSPEVAEAVKSFL